MDIVRYNKNKVKIVSLGVECFTKLSIGAEEDAEKETYIIYQGTEYIVEFTFSILSYFKKIEDSIDHIGPIYSYLELDNLIIFLEQLVSSYVELHPSVAIVKELLKYIKNPNNQKHILYTV